MRPASSVDCDVIIVNYNAGEFLARCVASVLPEVSGRVIVVDNGSGDDSVAELAAKYGAGDRVDIIRKGENTGFAAACNTGIRAVRAQYLLFLNPDCLVRPGSLQRMMAVLQADPQAGMVGGLLLEPDGTEQAGGRRAVPTPWRAFVRAFGLYRLGARWPLFSDVNLHEQPLPPQPVEVEAISGALMLVCRNAVDNTGPWDEGYFLHCEDLDWCMRFRQHGWKILFVPDAPVVHEKGVCSRSRPVFVEWHKHRGMARFYRKFFRERYPQALMWLVYAGVWLRFALVVLREQVRKIIGQARA